MEKTITVRASLELTVILAELANSLCLFELDCFEKIFGVVWFSRFCDIPFDGKIEN